MKTSFAVVFLISLASSCAAAAPATQPGIVDKTLVAWVSPANLTQRGGSVLTLDDQRSHFDGIVFGELSPGKWMAGSDFFRRTQKDQSNYPAETADPATFVQIAIVYRDREVTIYRNAQPYARYTMTSPPQRLGPRYMVLMGQRHQAQNDKARFAGAIDDARIYDRALSAEQIAALKPNHVSDPAPWAWWTFDDAKGTERIGRFQDVQLAGGAKVDEGKLVLNSTTATLIARTAAEVPFEAETPAMPANPPAEWLTFHLAHPGPGIGVPGDPNCVFFHNGRYHLHYIYKNDDGFAFAHVSSADLLHWKWHPTTLTPATTAHGMFSGTGFYTKEGKAAIIYHGQGSGRNQVAVALDDNLEKWSKPIPVEPKVRPDLDGSKIAHWDPDAWLDGDTYYALSGGHPGSGKPPTLMKSVDLKTWDYLGLFLSHDMPGVQKDEDVSCPNFFKIGNKWMLLCISHNKGCRYYLGDWKNERFTPDFHGRMNWKDRDFFAPESVLAPDGRRIMWAWCFFKGSKLQSGIQSLPRELSLPEDGILRITPIRELEKLRHDPQTPADITLQEGLAHPLQNFPGDALELSIEASAAGGLAVDLFADAGGKQATAIRFDPRARSLTLGTTSAPFELKAGEPLRLRIFIDKSMVEVFANDRQAIVGNFPHPPDNQGLRITSNGGAANARVQAWKLKSIYAAP